MKIIENLHGVGSACTCALSEQYILLSKITQDNYDKSIPEVKQLWESQGPRSKKDLFYIVVYENYGNLAFEGAMKLSDINKKLGVNLPTGMSTMVLFKLGTTYVPDPRVVIPYDNLNYFLLIMKEFYKRKVTVIANGKNMTAADLDMYKYKIIKTIIPEDTSKNSEVKVLIYFDVDPEMSNKSSYGSVNGLVVNTGQHLNYVEACFDQAIRAEYKITHKYTMNGFKSCVVLLAEVISFDSQTKVRLKSIGKVKQSDFTEALVKEFVKIFRSDSDYWRSHVDRLNTIYNSMRSFSAEEKAQKIIESASGNSMYRSKSEMVPGYAPATAGANDRFNCELWVCEGQSAAGSLISGRRSPLYQGIVGLRGKVLNSSELDIDRVLENKEFYTIFSLMGLGVDIHNVTIGCKTAEEAYERIKKYAKYGKLVICTDEDSDGSQIRAGILYCISKFARFMLDFGLVYYAEGPLFKQDGKIFYQSDMKTGELFPSGLNPNRPYSRFKGIGSVDVEDVDTCYFNPSTRRLIQVTTENIGYAMSLTEDINVRKKLLFDAGIITNPYGFTDL